MSHIVVTAATGPVGRAVVHDLLESDLRTELERIRSLVKQLVPSAEETMSYGMPTFKYKNQPLVYFTASKNHMSFFPSSGPIEALQDRLQDYKTTQHAVKFTVKKPLPEELIRELTLLHLHEIAAD